MLLARPGFRLVAVLSLALGIGANTTIFSLINTSLRGSLPYPEPERLVVLWTSRVGQPGIRFSATGANYLAWKEQSRSFTAVGASFGFPSNLGAEGNGAPAERIEAPDGCAVSRHRRDFLAWPPRFRRPRWLAAAARQLGYPLVQPR